MARFIPKKADCAECNKCYQARIEEMAVIGFILGMFGCCLTLVIIKYVFHWGWYI